MKKYVLIFYLFFTEISVLGLGNQCELQEHTLNFIKEFCGVLRFRDAESKAGHHRHMDSDIESAHIETMAPDLARIGKFRLVEYQRLVYSKERDEYFTNTVIEPAIAHKIVLVAGENRLVMSRSLITAPSA